MIRKKTKTKLHARNFKKNSQSTKSWNREATLWNKRKEQNLAEGCNVMWWGELGCDKLMSEKDLVKQAGLPKGSERWMQNNNEVNIATLNIFS